MSSPKKPTKRRLVFRPRFTDFISDMAAGADLAKTETLKDMIKRRVFSARENLAKQWAKKTEEDK